MSKQKLDREVLNLTELTATVKKAAAELEQSRKAAAALQQQIAAQEAALKKTEEKVKKLPLAPSSFTTQRTAPADVELTDLTKENKDAKSAVTVIPTPVVTGDPKAKEQREIQRRTEGIVLGIIALIIAACAAYLIYQQITSHQCTSKVKTLSNPALTSLASSYRSNITWSLLGSSVSPMMTDGKYLLRSTANGSLEVVTSDQTPVWHYMIIPPSSANAVMGAGAPATDTSVLPTKREYTLSNTGAFTARITYPGGVKEVTILEATAVKRCPYTLSFNLLTRDQLPLNLQDAFTADNNEPLGNLKVTDSQGYYRLIQKV